MDVIQVSESEVKKVRKQYRVKADDVKRDVNIIKEWVKQQQHLPNIDGQFLNRN